MSSTSPLCLPSKSNTLLLYFLFMSGILPPIFWFFSSVSHCIKRFFIRLILRFSSSVSHWVRRFFIYHVLSSFTLVRLYAQRSSRPRRKAIVILWPSGLKLRDNQVTWRVLILTSTFTFLSKTLLYHIDNAIGLGGKNVIAIMNVCDSEGIFLLTNTYATQVI